ncbi:hypothetical protein CTI12_AA280320 [Artemisia annua]|uniref:Replication protein A 70 kDa DNA-binding subunit B/D first OB fold domain-containing protein n=1 Tax=Artemisia annua TaxID=35608 RepID=A0A2U1NDA4_ARTAN|nr:hypothetical protein CTI12_AA280320 [Artemisia annua]
MADQVITALSDIDPMLDDAKILVRVVRIWKAHPLTRPNEIWSLEVLFQDEQGNRIQASIKKADMNKFQAILDEGSCYKVGSFGVGENGGKFPLLSHRYKIGFYKNTSVTRVAPFDQNTRGFRKMYQEMDGYVEKNIILNVFSPSKKKITSDEFFENAQAECIVYAMIHKVHQEHGWWYLACKKCGSIAKEPEDNGGSSSSKKKGKNKVWWCKKDKEITHVGPRYKVIVRVIDDTGSASLLLYEDIILKLIDIPCSKLITKYGDQADDIFPDELAPIVGKKLLFRFLISSYNINFNNHVYQVKMISQDEDMIKTFKHGFINEENDGETKTPTTPVVTANKFNSIDNIPFNIEQTPEVVDQMEKDADGSSSSGKGKRDVINLDEPVEEDVAAKKMKNAATVEKANGNE